MAFPRSFIRQTLVWSLPGGEVANCTIAWDNGAGVVGLDPATTNAFANRSLGLWNAMKANWSNETAYLGSKIAWITVAGTTQETIEVFDTPNVGGDSNPSLPTEVAVVASLKTAVGTRRGRGRIYLPAVARSASQTAGRFSHGSRDNVAAAVADYCAALTIGADTYVSVVASKLAGQLNPVTRVLVGDVFDSQRRRRDALVEAYAVEDV